MRSTILLLWLAPLCIAIAGWGQSPPAWVARSNQNSQLLVAIQARYSPEEAASSGAPGLDEQTSSLSPEQPERFRRDTAVARIELQKRLAAEKDPLVRQDLEILIAQADRDIRSSEASERNLLPYYDIAGYIFFGVQSLLDDQISADRRPAAVVRLLKYTGVLEGFEPITIQAEERFREKLKTPGLVGPAKAKVEKDLENTNAYVNGIGLLLEKYKMRGYQEAFAKLKEQLASYDDFVRGEVLPKSRTDFRLPPELYTIALQNYGIDYTPEELTRLAHQTFTELQNQMQPIAGKIAKERNLPSSDYRDVIAALKKDQIPGDQLLPDYQKRLAEIEGIIRREHLVTLPDRPAIIRLATAAETAQTPAPHMVPPPLMNNHGERGQFVLPLETAGKGGKTLKYDDFSFAAASWTLTAHEARPGHELQFDAMVERGVSIARALFAFNSTNVEGWGLYSEWMMLPYMPDDAKLVSLDYRLLPRRPCVSRSGTAAGQDYSRAGHADFGKGRGMLARTCNRGSGALYFPLAWPSPVVFRRLHAPARNSHRRRESPGSQVQRPALPRLHPVAGSAAARRAAQGRDGRFRQERIVMKMSRPL